MHTTRDPGITVIRARPNRRAYGMGLGIILLDDVYPLWTGGLRSDPPSAVYAKAEAEFPGVAVDFVRQHPNMGALVLECTGVPPFARALQREIDMAVFSWGTLLDYAYGIVVHRDYYGHV